MKPINIYALTRLDEPRMQMKLERQMSGRKHYLKIKEWEIQDLKAFCTKLEGVSDRVYEMEFFYSFVMQKLGKEFDLLRVNAEYVVNVELKSQDVPDEVVQKQLLQNRHYLGTLGRTIYSYTFVSGQDRLVRLSNSGRLVEAHWEELAEVLHRQTDCYESDIEELFKEDKYLISPLTDPGRFLRQEYFLTSQQKDIKKHILKKIKQADRGEGQLCVQGFTGLPGTGKTILLYDIAMQLSWREKVCILHFGSWVKELEQLDERLKRIDFYDRSMLEEWRSAGRYAVICVDEGHRIDEVTLQEIMERAAAWNAPVIFSYDREDAISPQERLQDGARMIEAIPGYVAYQLTNRIRVNSELSAFIGCVMCKKNGNHRREYPSVSLVYANDSAEAGRFLHNYEAEGYVYIQDAVEVARKEFDRVVMRIDVTFRYEETGYLRSEGEAVRNLFHGMSRAKKNVALVVQENEKVFETILEILQNEKGRL